jgi:hypothetical protein
MATSRVAEIIPAYGRRADVERWRHVIGHQDVWRMPWLDEDGRLQHDAVDIAGSHKHICQLYQQVPLLLGLVDVCVLFRG